MSDDQRTLVIAAGVAAVVVAVMLLLTGPDRVDVTTPPAEVVVERSVSNIVTKALPAEVTIEKPDPVQVDVTTAAPEVVVETLPITVAAIPGPPGPAGPAGADGENLTVVIENITIIMPTAVATPDNTPAPIVTSTPEATATPDVCETTTGWDSYRDKFAQYLRCGGTLTWAAWQASGFPANPGEEE